MTGDDPRELTRRRFLRISAAAAACAASAPVLRAADAFAGPAPSPAGMNLVLFITDQEREIRHFPPGWAARNLPGLTRLRRQGVTFDRAFTNAGMCSPARGTLMTGYFPEQHGVKYTLEEDMPAPDYPQVELPTDLPNIATVMAAAGYDVVYKGKWHLSKPAGAGWAPSDLARYGFTRWNSPDSGANQDPDQAGGGSAAHDVRYMSAVGDPDTGGEGVLQFLASRAGQTRPFCLVIALVNPHDVLMYPRTFDSSGYFDTWLQGDIRLPPTVAEDQSTKPDAQRRFTEIFNLSGPLPTPAMKRNYLNFYGNLMREQDAYLVDVLGALEAAGLLEDTVIVRTADHGEMGLAHGGMRQKNFNAYEETIRIPLVWSNPRLFPRPRRSGALVSHVDLLPTLATLFGAPQEARAAWEGRDYSELVLDPRAQPVQDHVVFTYDDFQSGQANPPYVPPPNHVVAIREGRWKAAKYFDVNGQVPPQWEVYDLRADPLERRNLAWTGRRGSRAERRQVARLREKVDLAIAERVQPL